MFKVYVPFSCLRCFDLFSVSGSSLTSNVQDVEAPKKHAQVDPRKKTIQIQNVEKGGLGLRGVAVMKVLV